MTHYINEGQKISGRYLGMFPYNGTITNLRPLHLRRDGAFEATIQLDQQITVFGETKTTLLIWLSPEGRSVNDGDIPVRS